MSDTGTPPPVLATLERLDAEGRVQGRWSGDAQPTEGGFRFPGRWRFSAGARLAVVCERRRHPVTEHESEFDPESGAIVALRVTCGPPE